MKKQQTICTLLGISQQDAAMLFGVGRSQWSMFDSGKRDLPPHATQLLAEIITHMQTPEKKTEYIDAMQQNATKQQLERLLRENEYMQLLAAKKIAITTKKQEQQLALTKLANFLKHRDNDKRIDGLHTIIASQISEVPYAALLTQQHHRKEILEFEKKLLESKLQQLYPAAK